MSVTEDSWRLQVEAEALIDLGRHEQALGVLARAVALEPDASRPHALRAQCLLALDRNDEAGEAASAAIAREPESAHAHRLLAMAQLGQGTAKAAKATALQAVGLDPEEPFNYVVLAEALQARRDEAGALAAARRAIELDPENPVAHDLEGRLLLAHDDIAGAEASFRRALALHPEDDGILNNLAIVLGRQGKREQAVAGLQAAARMDPADELVRGNVLAMARSHLSWVRWLAGILALLGVLAAVIGVAAGTGVAGALVTAAVLIALAAALYEWGMTRVYARLPEPTGQLLRDDHRARRLKPWRWHWSSITSLRPWWWLLLQRIPPPVALLVNLVLGLAVPFLLLGVPFSAWRAWRWYRREHPARGSWRASR